MPSYAAASVLVLVATGARTVTGVVMGEREGRQPGFAARRPEFVGGGEGVRRVEGAEIDLDLVVGTGKDRAAAARAEVTVVVARRVAGNAHGGLREDGIAGEECAGVLAAIQAMAEADAIGGAGGGEGDGAAEAGGGGHGGLAVGLLESSAVVVDCEVACGGKKAEDPTYYGDGSSLAFLICSDILWQTSDIWFPSKSRGTYFVCREFVNWPGRHA